MKKRLCLVCAVLLLLSGCYSNTPCSCGATKTKAYKNEHTGEKEYYCDSCASDCAYCSDEATQYYASASGRIIFICDDCYDYIQNLGK